MNKLPGTIWYPYAQMKLAAEPLEIVGAQGVRLISSQYGELIDGISSWWCAVHGYRHPELDAALNEQIAKFAHISLAGLVHHTALRLADKLAQLLPGTLRHCFYSDSGSVGVEVALKMARQYHINQGNNDRTLLLALTHAYHGDTFMAMQASDFPEYHQLYASPGLQSHVIRINPTIDELEQAFACHGSRLYGFILEPRLQCAGGFYRHGDDFLGRARELCILHDVPLICDEVATGFGRTGSMFASETACPDIIILGKALTAGYIGHAVTVACDKIYQAFYADDVHKAFMHGPTFMGNPLACAVALKGIEIMEREHYLDKIALIESYLQQRAPYLASFPQVKEVRICGASLCAEVRDPSLLKGLQSFAAGKGVFLRPFGKNLYTMPPYVISQDDLGQILDVMEQWFNR